MTAFTDDEKARIRHHLGYPSWQQRAPAIILGYPSTAQPGFLLEDAFHRLNEAGRNRVRFDVCQCDQVEAQLADGRSRLKAAQLGNLTLNHAEHVQLRQELQFWTQRLADDLGVVPNPYAGMQYHGMPGGVNAKVQ